MVAQDDKFRVLRKLPEVRFEEELRGYSKSQVDRVLQGLAPLADDVASLQQRLADAETRAAAAEARLVEARAAQPAAQPATPAAQPAPVSPASFDETLSKTLLLAQRTADQTVADAKVEAEGLVASARAEAEELQNENARARREASAEVAQERQALLEAAHAEVQAKIAAAEASLTSTEGAQRDALVAEIVEYRQLRDDLLTDIERLEGHLAKRRETIRAALADIAIVVDDPARFHSEMPPIADAPVTVPSSDATTVVLDVEGVDDLAGDPTDAGPAADAASSASLLGELEDDGYEPTTAVPMVELLADDETHGEPTALVDVVSLSDDDGAESDGASANDDASTNVDDADHEDQAAPDLPLVDHDETDSALDDWGTVSAGDPDTAAIIVDEVRWDDSPSAQASPADFGFEEASDHVPSSGGGRERSTDELGRPAWAESVPDLEQPQVLTAASEDPFLDELRRATGDDAETDVALERFLTDNPDDDDRRSGWFNRRK